MGEWSGSVTTSDIEVTKVKEDGVNGDTKWDILGLQILYCDLSTKTDVPVSLCNVVVCAGCGEAVAEPPCDTRL